MSETQPTPRLKGLFYCQPGIGYGHYFRSLSICQELIKEFDIDFLMGAEGIGQTIDSPHFHLHFLKPLCVKDINEKPNRFSDPEGKLAFEEVMEVRKNDLKAFLTQSYAFFITEMFPFSKLPLSDEIEWIINSIKKINPNCLILCSLREMLLPIPMDRQLNSTKLVNQYYNFILVHSDPRIYRLENIVNLARQFANKIIYTGYVVNPLPLRAHEKRAKRILVSIGGGRYGQELIHVVAQCADALPDYEFMFILGPKTSADIRTMLENFKKEKQQSSFVISEFIPDFLQVMQDSALSISLGGATILDAIKTHTPAIVYPYAHDEHVIRALLFGQLGLVRLLKKNELNPENLKRIIPEVLSEPYPEYKIDLSGAESTLREVLRLLGPKS